MIIDAQPSRTARPPRRDPQVAWALPFAAPGRGRQQLGDCLCRRQTVPADHEGLERRCGTSRLDGQAGDRPSRGRRLAGLVRLRAASGGRRGLVPPLERRPACRGEVRAAFRAARERAVAGWCARRRRAEGGARSGLPRHDDLDLAARIGSVHHAADLDPFWAAADETGAVIHIHPSYDAGDTRVNDYGLANAASATPSWRWRGSSRAATSRASAAPRFSLPMGSAGLPFQRTVPSEDIAEYPPGPVRAQPDQQRSSSWHSRVSARRWLVSFLRSADPLRTHQEKCG
jgi:hypothetical protein